MNKIIQNYTLGRITYHAKVVIPKDQIV